MGGGQSRPCPTAKGHITETPAPARRMSVDRIAISCPNAGTIWGSPDHLLEQAFSGVWSNIFPKTASPPQRFGQFSVSTPSKAFVGFGVSSDGSAICDLWELDTASLTWREIPLSGHKINQLAGAAATIADNLIYVFNVTNAEVYSINTSDGTVSLLPAQGTVPGARASPVFQHVNGELVLWGGFNGEWLTTLSIYNIASGEWRESNPKVTGRAAASWALVDDIIYVFGGGDMIKVDLRSRWVEPVACKGTPPPSDCVEGQMVHVERFLLYFGGKSANCWTYVYAFDLVRQTWFVFFVRPDEQTVHLSDGKVSENGVFMLPRIHGFGAAYCAEKKRLVGFFGVPQNEQNPLYVLDIAEALATMHVYEDMLGTLQVTGETVMGMRALPPVVRSASQPFKLSAHGEPL